MTHRGPSRRWPRRPRHAASRWWWWWPAQVRPPARATIRLLAAAASIAAGLGLVVGAVALVAEVTALPPARHSTVADQRPAAYSAGEPHWLPGLGGRAEASGSAVIAQFTGHGMTRTRPFTIGGTGTWRLGWSYDCAALRHPGVFIVTAVNAGAPGGAPVEQTGLGGHGVSPAYAAAGVHSLAVDSGCAWQLRLLVGR